MKSTNKVLVPFGSVTIPIYYTPQKAQDKLYPAWTVKVARRHKIKPKKFTGDDALEKATAHAKTIAVQITNGQTDTSNLTNSDIAALARAREHLKPTGESIELAAEKYAAIIRQLPPGVTWSHILEDYKKRHAETLIDKTIAAAYTEFIAAKKSDGLAPDSLLDLSKRLNRFQKHFQCTFSQLTGPAIDDWLRTLKTQAPGKTREGKTRTNPNFKPKPLSNRSRYNFRTTIQTFCNYAKNRRYLPKDWSELDAVATPKFSIEKIEIFTPEEMQKMLNVANDMQLPFLAIAAFAGVRHEEIKRMTWSHIRWGAQDPENEGKILEGHITIPAANARKINRRRLVPLLPNLLEWLFKFRNQTGPICHHKDMGNQLHHIATKAGLDRWKRNALRHSFVSYRIAQVKNAPQVALESGNSVQKIFTNYRELVTPADASKWFSITPAVKDNIIKLTRRAIKNAAIEARPSHQPVTKSSTAI